MEGPCGEGEASCQQLGEGGILDADLRGTAVLAAILTATSWESLS